MCSRIILDKLRTRSAYRAGKETPRVAECASYAAAVSPAATSVFRSLWRPPLPRPLKGYRGAAVCGVVAYQVHVCVFVKIGVGMKFSRDKILDLARGGGADVGETRYVRVYGCRGGVGGRRVGSKGLLRLAHDKGKGKDELIVVAQLEEKGRGAVGARRRLGVLGSRGQLQRAQSKTNRGAVRGTDLDVFYGRSIADGSGDG